MAVTKSVRDFTRCYNLSTGDLLAGKWKHNERQHNTTKGRAQHARWLERGPAEAPAVLKGDMSPFAMPKAAQSRPKHTQQSGQDGQAEREN